MEAKKNMLSKGETKETGCGRKAILIQVLMCTVANTALLSSGMTLGFSAIALPYMTAPNDVFQVTTSQGSWIASLSSVSTPAGCLASGPLVDRLGRKTALLLLNLPALLGWLCIAVRPTLLQVYLGRLLTGFACGLSSIPATVYIAESSTPSIRGLLVTGTSIAISMGVAIVYILGFFLKENWQLVAGISSLFPVLSGVLILLLLPESPLWLMSQGRPDKAGAALKVLRATSELGLIQKELDHMAERTHNKSSRSNLGSAIKALARPQAYKPLLIMNFFFLFQQLTGIFVVIFYAVDVVREAGVTLDPFLVAVLIGLTRLVFTVLAAYLSRRLGRRPTALISGLGMTLSLLLLASYLLAQPPPENAPDSSFNTTLDWSSNTTIPDQPAAILPLLAILVYILASTIGFLTLPWSMIGEVFPDQVRGVAGGLTTCITYLVSFLMVKLYPGMLLLLHKHGVFYFYGTMALLGTLFVYFYLPETQGKTLPQIEQLFAKKMITNMEEEEALSGTKMVTIVSSKS